MTSARELSSRLLDLLRREQSAMADFLVALADFDRKRLWTELGYTSLFYFLHRELRLSAGAAFYRKAAAELIQRFPEVVEPLRDGRLCLTSVAELAKVLTPENRAEVLPRFFHASKQEAKAVAAEISPREGAPHRLVVTTVAPVLTARHATACSVAAAMVVSPGAVATPALALGQSFRLDETNAAQASVAAPRTTGAPPELALGQSFRLDETNPRTQPADAGTAVPHPAVGLPHPAVATPAPPRSSVDPLSADLRRLHVTVSRRFVEKLAAARDALSHSHPGADAEAILEAGLDLLIERAAKRKGCTRPKPGKNPGPTGSPLEAPKTAPSPSLSPAGERGDARRPPPDAGERGDARRPPPDAGERGETQVISASAGERGDARRCFPDLPGRDTPDGEKAASRHIPARVKREVWLRDGGRCQFRLENGELCGSTRRPQFDHVRPVALGGESTVRNVRVVCAPHNLLAARRIFGDALIDRYAPARSGSGIPEAR